VVVPADVYATIARGSAAALHSSAHLFVEPLIAPLSAAKPVGQLTITDASGQIIARIPLVPLTDVPPGGLWTRAMDGIALMFH
jgi:D-alanyl-D-alanine carboxypeptidase (penicillin-binding protein 5/6)